MADHAECPGRLRETWVQACADLGDSEPAEITVSTEPPLAANPYTAGLQCPHGVVFWIEPTGEQVVQWHADGVR